LHGFRENRSCDSTVGVIVAELNDKGEEYVQRHCRRKSNLAIHYDLGTQSPSSLFSGKWPVQSDPSVIGAAALMIRLPG
jgi:hypothetical protein